jgi:hypothetical protein
MSLTDDLPDFDAIAKRMCAEMPDTVTRRAFDAVQENIRLALVNAWNARGSADAQIIEASLTSQMGVSAAGPYVKNLERAVKALDQS